MPRSRFCLASYSLASCISAEHHYMQGQQCTWWQEATITVQPQYFALQAQAPRLRWLTPSQDDASSRSPVAANRRLEMPSCGGWASCWPKRSPICCHPLLSGLDPEASEQFLLLYKLADALPAAHNKPFQSRTSWNTTQCCESELASNRAEGFSSRSAQIMVEGDPSWY